MAATIEQVAARVKADNPDLVIGIDKEGGLIAVQADGHWHPVISATITGHWVNLEGKGLPLINGQRVYKDEDFVQI